MATAFGFGFMCGIHAGRCKLACLGPRMPPAACQVFLLATLFIHASLGALLQDRIASLNGKSVDLVLRQDLPGFVR